MKTIELIGDVDDRHRLHAQVPAELPAGPVRLLLVVPGEDDTGACWTHGITREWVAELADPRQDIYTLADGQPLDAPR